MGGIESCCGKKKIIKARKVGVPRKSDGRL